MYYVVYRVSQKVAVGKHGNGANAATFSKPLIATKLMAGYETFVTRRTSRQFNFSLHVKINHIEFEDKFLMKPTRM